MFNVSVLLPDDALKPATALTNGAINETLRVTLDISQHSVATNWRCGGIFSDSRGPPCILSFGRVSQSVCMSVCLCVCPSDDNFRKP